MEVWYQQSIGRRSFRTTIASNRNQEGAKMTAFNAVKNCIKMMFKSNETFKLDRNKWTAAQYKSMIAPLRRKGDKND